MKKIQASKTVPREKRVFKVDISGDERNIAAAIDKYLHPIKDKYGIVRNNQVAILCRSNSTAFKVGENLSTPCRQVGFAGIGVEHLTMQQLCTGAARRKFFIGFTHVAVARGGKGDDCFTLQIIAFQKCIDDHRSNIPPDRESDKDGVVFVHVITFGSDGRARGRVAHFDGTASLLVHPIQIGLGVWNFRLNLKNVCTDGIRQIFGNFCGDTAGRKVGDKSFAHGNALPLDDFV